MLLVLDPVGFAHAPSDIGKFDLILFDQPLGDEVRDEQNPSHFRHVEKTWTNKFRDTWKNDAVVQWPRFQAGKQAQGKGIERARAVQKLFGTAGVVIVESFPQLVLPFLMMQPSASAATAVVKLASHKKGPEAGLARQQLATLVHDATGCSLQPGLDAWASAGAADAMDAVLGLLPGIDWARGGTRAMRFHGAEGGLKSADLPAGAAAAVGSLNRPFRQPAALKRTLEPHPRGGADGKRRAQVRRARIDRQFA